MLVDAATKGSSEEVIDALSNRTEPITHLDILVASHMHDDHIGGMNEVLHYLDLHKDGNKIDLVLSNTDRGTTITATDFITQLDRMGNTLTVPAVGDIFPLGSATVEVIDNRAEKNNDSLVLLITYRDATFLFTGDMEQNQESQICDRYGDDDRWDITLLKVAHHGSKTSTSIRFLNILMPQYAVISVGDNSEGHPSEQTLSRFDQAEVKGVYRTDKSGDIIVEVDRNGRDLIIAESNR